MHLDERAEKFQAFVSTYTIDTAFSSFLELYPLEGTVPASITGLTTSELNIAFAGISDYYGDIPVDVSFKFNSIGKFDIQEAEEIMTAFLDVTIDLVVKKADGTSELAVSFDANSTNFSFNAMV